MDETAAPKLSHLTAEDLRAEEIAGQIDGENGIPLGQRQRVEPAGAQHRGGVDEDAARAQRFLDRLGDSGNALGAGRIAIRHDMVAAKFAQLRARRLQAAFVAIDGGNTGTGPRKTCGNGTADTTASPCHNAHAAREAEPIG